MSERKRRRLAEDAQQLELCAEDLRTLTSSIASCLFREPSSQVSVPLRRSVSSKPRDGPPKTAPRPSKSLYSVVSSAAYAAKTSATQQQDTWQLQLHRLATGLSEKESSNAGSRRLMGV
jgi:hypothetical protein